MTKVCKIRLCNCNWHYDCKNCFFYSSNYTTLCRPFALTRQLQNCQQKHVSFSKPKEEKTKCTFLILFLPDIFSRNKQKSGSRLGFNYLLQSEKNNHRDWRFVSGLSCARLARKKHRQQRTGWIKERKIPDGFSSTRHPICWIICNIIWIKFCSSTKWNIHVKNCPKLFAAIFGVNQIIKRWKKLDVQTLENFVTGHIWRGPMRLSRLGTFLCQTLQQ